MEIETVKCECCGIKEECTEEYISNVKSKFKGKWLCGLCAEAVTDSIQRGIRCQLDEAVGAHKSFCRNFRSNPAVHVADGMKQMLRRRSGVVDMSAAAKKFGRSVSALK